MDEKYTNAFIDSSLQYLNKLQYLARRDIKTLKDLSLLDIILDVYNKADWYEVSENDKIKLQKLLDCIYLRNPNLTLPTVIPGTFYSNVNTPQTIWTWQRIWDNLDVIVSDVETINYGALYNWYAVTSVKNLANTGWHVPTEADFLTLVNTIGYAYVGASDQAAKLKEPGYWTSSLYTGNTALFNGRGAGVRSNVYFGFKGYLTLQTATTGTSGYNKVFTLTNGSQYFSSGSQEKYYGSSVRLVKDSTTLTNGQSGVYFGNDGKIYRTICIGSQEWLADNLWETKYRDNTLIPIQTDGTAWAALTTGAMCYYNNDITKA